MLGMLSLNMACVKKRDIRSKPAFAPAKPEVVQIKPKHNGAIYQDGMIVGLFGDIKPQRVGDILTIVLEDGPGKMEPGKLRKPSGNTAR